MTGATARVRVDGAASAPAPPRGAAGAVLDVGRATAGVAVLRGGRGRDRRSSRCSAAGRPTPCPASGRPRWRRACRLPLGDRPVSPAAGRPTQRSGRPDGATDRPDSWCALGPRDDWFVDSAIEALLGVRVHAQPDEQPGRRAAGRRGPDPRARPANCRARAWCSARSRCRPTGSRSIFLADHPTTGGYPVIGVVDDVTPLAQARPGTTVTVPWTSTLTSARASASWRLGDDEALLDVVTSANVACGFHAGRPGDHAPGLRGRGRAGRRGRRAGRLPRPGRVRPPADRLRRSTSCATTCSTRSARWTASAGSPGPRCGTSSRTGRSTTRRPSTRCRPSAVVAAVLDYDRSLPVLCQPGSVLAQARRRGRAHGGRARGSPTGATGRTGRWCRGRRRARWSSTRRGGRRGRCGWRVDARSSTRSTGRVVPCAGRVDLPARGHAGRGRAGPAGPGRPGRGRGDGGAVRGLTAVVDSVSFVEAAQDSGRRAAPSAVDLHRHAPVLPGQVAGRVLGVGVAGRRLRDHLQHAARHRRR